VEGRSNITTDLLADDHAEVNNLFRELWREFDGWGGARGVFSRTDYLWARLAVHVRAEHNRTEEHVYLWPVAFLTESELDAVRAGTKREIENLPPRFSERVPR
jgi:hypothetical protein